MMEKRAPGDSGPGWIVRIGVVLGLLAIMWGLFLPTPGLTRISPAAAACFGNVATVGECLVLKEGQAPAIADRAFRAKVAAFRTSITGAGKVADPMLIGLLDRVYGADDPASAIVAIDQALDRVAALSPTFGTSATPRRFSDAPIPWVAPSQVDATGHDVGALVVGAPVSGLSAIPADVVDPATVGPYCAVRVVGFSWSLHVVTVSTAGEGAYYCSAPISLSSSWPLPYRTCYVDGVQVSQDNLPLGQTSDGGATWVYTPACPGEALACVSWTKQEPDWSGHWDGFTTCDPAPTTATLSIVVLCSDSSTHTDLVPDGQPVTPPTCPPGSVVTSVTVRTSTGQDVGSVTTHGGFPEVCRTGTCLPWVNVGGVWSSITDATSAWWRSTVAPAIPDGCGWAPAGTSDPTMFASLLAADCSDAWEHHAVFPDPVQPPPTSSASGTDYSPVLEAIKQLLRGIGADVAHIKDWLNGIRSAFDREKQAADDKAAGVNAEQAEGIVSWWGPLMAKMPTETAYTANCGFVVPLMGAQIPICPWPAMIPIMEKLRGLADVVIPVVVLVNLLWSLAQTFRLHGDGGR